MKLTALKMKLTATIILMLSAIPGFAQSSLVPASNAFEKKWIKNDTYEMMWYFIRDTSKFEIGKVTTHIIPDAKKITVVAKVDMKNVKDPWVDSTVANRFTLEPIHHSSSNIQRDMVLNFGKVVTGFYNDKMKKQNTLINDTANATYFDSNLYPYLIGWLPLKEGYQQNISIYDYNPSAKIGVLSASVKDVKSGIYKSEKSGDRNVWVVTVSDEIAGDDASTIYYFDKEDRKLWKQELNIGDRKMIMQTIE